MEPKNNKKIITVVGIVLALAVAIIAGTLIIQATPANKLKRQLKLAEKYLTEMNYEQALIAYSEAIKIDPKCEKAYLAMADIYIKQGEEEKAIAILEEGQKNIQTDALTEKIEEAKKKAASAGQAEQQIGETPTKATTQAPTETPTKAPTQEPTESPTETSTEGPTQAPTEEATKTPTESATEAPTQAPTTAPAKTGIQSANAGEYITLGSYEQDGNTGNGAEPIEWLVLDNQGNKMLVISRYGLDCQPYNIDAYIGWETICWETCTLRNWLNSEFYNTAFSDSEKASVITTTVENPDNAIYGTRGGNATSDNVFCLSIDEVNRYFASGETRVTKPTAYAVSRGAYASTSTGWYAGNCAWWLRSLGNNTDFAALLLEDGNVYDFGYDVDGDSFAVRPAMWIAVNP
ncbi:MAG: DUF6273 domain-containing protein [Bacteroides sp.]